MFSLIALLAQRPGFGADDWVYVVVVIVTTLGGLGKWLAEKYASQTQQKKPGSVSAPPTAPAPTAQPARPVAPATFGSRDTAPAVAQPRRNLPTAPRRDAARPTATPRTFRSGAPSTAVPRPATPRPLPPELQMPTVEGIRVPARRKDRPHGEPQRVPVAAGPRAPRPAAEELSKLTKALSQRAGEIASRPDPGGPGDWRALSLSELRRAIVLNEVLGPPVALRRVSRLKPLDD
jgi:hypothetical protein